MFLLSQVKSGNNLKPDIARTIRVRCLKKSFFTVSILVIVGIAGCVHTGVKPGNKVVSGVLKEDTTLSGRIEVNGDLLVPAGITLNLQPGTELVFLPAQNSRVEPRYIFSTTELLVRGTLKALGTSDRPILFTSPVRQPKAWAGIILDRSSTDIIRNVIVEYAEYGVYIVGSSPEITDSLITHTVYGIMVHKDARPKIKNNRIENSQFGIFLGPDAQIIEQGNHFEKIERKYFSPDFSDDA